MDKINSRHLDLGYMQQARRCTCEVALRRVRAITVAVEKQLSVALRVKRAMSMRHIVICSLPRC
jgi:hypothetical protein